MSSTVKNRPTSLTTAAPAAPESTAPEASTTTLEDVEDIAGTVWSAGGPLLNPFAAARQAVSFAQSTVAAADIFVGGSEKSLKPGEKSSDELAVKAGDGVGVQAKLTVDTERTNDGFDVSGSIDLQAGARAASDHGDALVMAGGGVDVSFDAKNADEAAHAKRVIGGAAAVFSQGAAAAGPMGGAAAVAASGMLDDARSVGVHVSGSAAAEGIADFAKEKLAVNLPSAEVLAAVHLKAESNATLSVRVEKGDDGKKRAVFEQRLEVAGGASAEAGVGIPEGGASFSVDAKGSVAIVHRTSYELPDDFPMSKGTSPVEVAAAVRGKGTSDIVVEAEERAPSAVVEAEFHVATMDDAAKLAAAQANGTPADVRGHGEVRRYVAAGGPAHLLSNENLIAADSSHTKLSPAGKPIECDGAGAFARTLAKQTMLAGASNFAGLRLPNN